jgi:hypothetical protein
MPSHPLRARRRGAALILLCLSFPVMAEPDNDPPAAAMHALDLVLPESRWAVRAELRSTQFDRVYDSNGDRRPFASEFDNVALDASVFLALAALGPGASLGTTSLSAEARFERLELTFGYGLTENLTLGAIVPMGRSQTNVDFSVLGGNVGWNPAFDPTAPIGPANYPFAPVGFGATEPLGTAGVQQVLTDPIFGFAYQPAQTTSRSQMCDPTLGALYRFHRSSKDSATLGLGVRFGVARDDPDDLFDVPLDDGSDDLLGKIEYFRRLGTGYDLRALVKRTVQTSDRVEKRVPVPGTLLATASTKETLDRDLGDYWEYDLEIGKSLGPWRLSGTWHRWDKARDRYSSPSGQDTSVLEINTGILADQWRMGLSWSGVESWRSGSLPLPIVVKLEMQDTYRGRNMTDVRDLYLIVTTLF